MNFIYNEKVDKECIERLKVCDTIFGEKKKTESYSVNQETVEKFKSVWSPTVNAEFCRGMYEIFDIEFPTDFTCYINSTPYSMDTKDGIAISVATHSPIQSICHEANHFMFRRSNYAIKYFPSNNIEDAKEIFTIINNIYFQDIMEGQDIGWKKFWKERYTFLQSWIKDHK